MNTTKEEHRDHVYHGKSRPTSMKLFRVLIGKEKCCQVCRGVKAKKSCMQSGYVEPAGSLGQKKDKQGGWCNETVAVTEVM
jgi:hypothetical protein